MRAVTENSVRMPSPTRGESVYLGDFNGEIPGVRAAGFYAVPEKQSLSGDFCWVLTDQDGVALMTKHNLDQLVRWLVADQGTLVALSAVGRALVVGL